MTTVEVHDDGGASEHADASVSTEQLADAMASAQVEAAHQLEQEAAVERAEDIAEQASEDAAQARTEALEAQYHDHPELHERLTAIETRLSEIAAAAVEAVAESQQQVEEIEPHSDTPAEVVVQDETPAPATRVHGLRRGR